MNPYVRTQLQLAIAMTDNIKKPDNTPAARQLDKENRRIRNIEKELMKILDQLSIVKVGITSNAISASKHKYLRCIMKKTIYRLYTSSKQMKLASYCAKNNER